MVAMPTPNQPSNRSHDPVRARRQQVARWTLIANRVGYLLFALCMAVFFMGFAFGFSPGLVAVVTTCLVLGSILLAPAIVLGYAVKAAERDDRERGF
jgi:hypothetical protein